MDPHQNIQKVLSVRTLGYGNLTSFEHLENRFLFNMGHGLYSWSPGDTTLHSSIPGRELSSVSPEFVFISPSLPSIREIQIAALQYNRLSTKRMKSWERRARLRGLVPSVSFDIDKSSSNNINLDRGSTSTTDVFIDGPDEKDWDFSFGVGWDLANLIWNDDETSIEIRARALVDQREEVLNEVTRLYFEYRRLRLQESLESQIRQEEILALLDGLSGGYVTEYGT